MQVAEQRETQLLAKAVGKVTATQAQHEAVLLNVQQEHQHQQVGLTPGLFEEIHHCGIFHTITLSWTSCCTACNPSVYATIFRECMFLTEHECEVAVLANALTWLQLKQLREEGCHTRTVSPS